MGAYDLLGAKYDPVYSSGFWFRGSGFRFLGLGLDLWYKICGLGSRVWDLGFGGQGFRVKSLEFGSRVEDLNKNGGSITH